MNADSLVVYTTELMLFSLIILEKDYICEGTGVRTARPNKPTSAAARTCL